MKWKDIILHPERILFSIGMRGGFHFLDDRTYLKLMYRCMFGKKLNLDHPVTYNEKLQWLKLYDRNPLYRTLVDKYKVKSYVAGLIGEKYIIPTLGVWDSFDDIDFDRLPDQFVLKCTHDSGGIVICKDKKRWNKQAARKKLTRALRKNYYWIGREWPYQDIRPQIIAEQYIDASHVNVEAGNESDPFTGIQDYKLFTFQGKTEIILVCSDRFGKDGLTEDFFDVNWNHLDIRRLKTQNSHKYIRKPQNLDVMCQLAYQLAHTTNFARVDFYEVDGTVYFGEITLYPASGFDGFEPEDWDFTLGHMLTLDFVQ